MSSIFGTVSNIYNNPSSSTLPQDLSKMDYKLEFLKMLLVQLKNQDPTSPMDSKEMLAQQAQFASLEQMQNLNTNFISMMMIQNVAQATSSIGKNVDGKDSSTGISVTGKITGVIFEDGTPFFRVHTASGTDLKLSLGDVTEIYE